MYVVTYDGKKLKVDDSSIDYKNDWVPFQQKVGLYTEDTVLIPLWKLVGEHRESFARSKPSNDLELIAEKVYDHRPTKEEILWFMSANGLSRNDIVTIQEGYSLGMEGDSV